ARHRALIAMCCAVSRRPFNVVKGVQYVQEVGFLRPGTVIPSPTLVLVVRWPNVQV
ncbi:hypothetical protein BDN67DRAFT_906691, partial [Paxillus ammoniavirescens]